MWDQLLERGVTGAPVWVEYIGTVIGSAAIFIGARLNWLKGKNGGASSSHMGEIAGAVIDKQMAEALVAALEKNSAAQRALGRVIEANTEVVKDTGRLVDEARTDVRKLEEATRLLAAKQ